MTPLCNWRKAVVAFVATAVLGLSGCNMGGGKSSPNGTGGAATAHLGLSSSRLDFGDLPVGRTIQMHVQVTNSSSSNAPSVTVTNVTASGAGFTAKNKLPVDIAPGETAEFTALFTPATTGQKSGTLSIDVVGAPDPVDIALSGNGVPNPDGTLTVSPSTLSFGSVTIGSSKNMTSTLTAGSASVTVSSAGWNGSGYSLSGITFPLVLQAGKSKTFTVTFAPQSTGSAPGSVSFVSSAPNSPTAASFTGSGAQPTQAHNVGLSWVASGSSVSGYNIYRGTQSGGPYSKVNGSLRTATNYSDGTVESGETYFYVATAVNSSSVESDFSNEVMVTVPTP